MDVPASQRSRRKVVSLRGKRGYNYEWPKVDVQVLQEAYEELRRPYRRYWEDRDPQGTYRLTRSAFLSRAMEVALASPGEWLSQVRNSGTRAPVAGGSKQVFLIWDVQLDEQVVDAFETAARERGEDGFVMTKQRFAVAGLLWAVGSAQEWYLSCENDDRLREPTAQDGRRSAPVEDGADS